MKHTLYRKFLLVYLLFGFLSFLTIALFTSNLTLNHLIQQKADDLYKEATLVSSQYANSYYNNTMDLQTVHSHLQALDTYMSAQIWIISPQGNIIANSREKLDTEHLVTIEGFNPASNSHSFYSTGNFYGMFSDDTLSVVYPITSGITVKGYIALHTSMTQIIQSRDRILNISYISLLVIFLLSTIILIGFTYMVFLPLRKITAATNEYAHGNFKHQISINKDDEIGRLAHSLNFMASELDASEEYQKKFIANISHDFRSPLTSIKGYLEAILDGTIPPEMQEKYLNIVLSETARLNKLTQSMLLLNNLNSKELMLEKTNFDINKVIKDTAASFGGSCMNKNLSIELILTGQSLYVFADMSKIQQVLYNLIDNAIKFSNHNSVIYIETTEKSEKVLISVKDTGIGIPKESINQIWDRFYKIDTSRGKDKKGTGLGLSIVKEIIQVHNENINVVSTEDVGTEFIFTLAKAKGITQN